MNKIFILGAGGFGKEVGLVLKEQGLNLEGYVSDDSKQWTQDYRYGRCCGSIEMVSTVLGLEEIFFIPGIGNPELREKLVSRARQCGWQPLTVISPKAMLGEFISIGNGSVICSGVSATVDIKIGNYVNINLNCTLGHDSILKDYVNLSPNVNISGNTILERYVNVGTGSVILPNIKIGERSVIGAGATVINDIPPGEVWVGTPAKFLRTIG